MNSQTDDPNDPDVTTIEDAQLVAQRLSGRVSELEAWFGLLLARYGHAIGAGWQLVMDDAEAAQLRARLARGEVSVSITYDEQQRRYVINAL